MAVPSKPNPYAKLAQAQAQQAAERREQRALDDWVSSRPRPG